MNKRELAKDFVVALISSGKIDTAQSSVQYNQYAGTQRRCSAAYRRI